MHYPLVSPVPVLPPSFHPGLASYQTIWALDDQRVSLNARMASE